MTLPTEISVFELTDYRMWRVLKCEDSEDFPDKVKLTIKNPHFETDRRTMIIPGNTAFKLLSGMSAYMTIAADLNSGDYLVLENTRSRR